MGRFENIWLRFRNTLLALAIYSCRLLMVLVAVVPTWIGLLVGSLRGRKASPVRRRPPAARKPRVLFIGGTINHTMQVHQIAAALPECEHAYTWYYCDGLLELLRRKGALENTAVGFKLRARCRAYLEEHHLPIDLGGAQDGYDLAVTCSDLSVPDNLRGQPLVLVQEGMTDPEDLVFRLIKHLRLPPWLATTSSTTGLSHAYDRLCVASEGYRQLFAHKGVPLDKIVVTGIPNFDNCERLRQNTFPHRGYVLVCSSDIRETARWENRPEFIRSVLAIAGQKQIVWKLHPNENEPRARSELARLAPQTLVYSSGSAEEMIANCEVLVTQYSSTAYVGLALGKQVHSYFDVDELRRLCPVQNGGASARRIADVCRDLLGLPRNTSLLRSA